MLMKEKLHKNSLASKLAKYSAAAGAILAISSNADAQVAYSGLQDITINGAGTFAIDLDGDGNTDFNIGVSNSISFNYANIQNPASNSWLGNPVYALSSSYLVQSTLSWTNSFSPWNLGSYYTSAGMYWGNFPGAGDQYIGVKFEINSGEFHNGWIKINLSIDCTTLIVRDWAYDQTKDVGINTGDKGDITSPTVVLSTSVTEPVNGEFDITITFDEEVNGLEEGEIQVTNGTLKAGSLVTSDGGITYTATITPTATGDVTISLPSAVAQDLAGNDNEAATDLIVEADLTSGIDMLQEAYKVLVYPNPTKGSVKIDLSNSELDINSITITDLSGRQLHNQEITNNLVNLDLDSYEKGVYILIMQTNSAQITKKIVIQ